MVPTKVNSNSIILDEVKDSTNHAKNKVKKDFDSQTVLHEDTTKEDQRYENLDKDIESEWSDNLNKHSNLCDTGTIITSSNASGLSVCNEPNNNLTFLLNLVVTMIRSYFEIIADLVCQPLGNFCKSHKKLVQIIGLIIILVIAFVQSRGNAGQHAFETQRLFTSHPFVTDYFYGELSLLREVIQRSDISCILYYAPWDRQSQNVVPHFLKAAAYHHEQVSFAAINCWLPDSECRNNYRLTQYPVVVLHICVNNYENILSIPYEGPLDSHHLIQFISNAYRPFVYVSSRSQLLALKLEHQAIVLGYSEDLSSRSFFMEFYHASVNKLQYEHMNSVVYALITNPSLATSLSFTEPSSLHMILYNSTMIYPNNLPKNQKNITEFVNIHLAQLTKWLHVDGLKRSALNTILKGGPVLVLFTPYNPYLPSNDPFRMLHSVTLEYFNCQNSSLLLWLSNNLRMAAKTRLRESDQLCRVYLKDNLFYDDRLYQSLSPSGTKQDSHDDSYCSSKANGLTQPPLLTKESSFISQFTWNSLLTYMDSTAISIKNFCSSGDSFSKSCSSNLCKNQTMQNNHLKVSTEPVPSYNSDQSLGGPREDDIIARLMDWLSEEHCKRLVLGSAFAYPPVLKDTEKLINIEGLGCMTNRTLNFVAIDSLLHKDLASDLGLDLDLSVPRNAGAIIIDNLAEERYILNEPLSRNVLSSFILNYTNNLMTRSKKSSDPSSSRGFCSEELECITDINSENYLKITQVPEKTCVVLHYSSNCGACLSLAHVVLAAMHVTSHIKNLEFVRIDVSKNTLPWHLTFENVPMLIIYPAFRKSESRILSTSSKVSLQSILLFISYGLTQQQRQQIALKLCDAQCQQYLSSQSLVHNRKLRIELSNAKAKYHELVSALSKLNSNHLNINRGKIDALMDLKLIAIKNIKWINKKSRSSNFVLKSLLAQKGNSIL